MGPDTAPMYRDSYSESGWRRFLRWISASFRLGRFFRVEVRLFWLSLLITPLVISSGWRGSNLPAAEVLSNTAIWTVLLYLVIYTHEMGHILAGRRYGISTPLITLSPMGGLAHMSSGAPNPRAEIIVSVAGPCVHLLWLAVFWPLSELVGPDVGRPEGWSSGLLHSAFDFLRVINLWLMIFNLLPLFPMDGGRVLRALLAKRMHPNRASLIAARVGMIGAVVFGIVGLVMMFAPAEQRSLWGIILLVIGISNFFACKQETMAARHSAGPYQEVSQLEAWQTDPDAWKAAQDDTEERESRKPGALSRWKERRAEARASRQAAAAGELEAEVDRILAKVSSVGMDGLTPAERETLMKASRSRRS